MRGIRFVGARLVLSNEPWGSLGCVRSISVRPGVCRVRSVHSRAPCGSFGIVWFIDSRPGVRRVLSGAFGPFPCALRVVWIVRVPLLHFRAPWGSSGSFGCVRPIPERLKCRRVRLAHSRTPSGSSGSFGCVRSIPMRPGSRRVRSCAFGPFSCALGVVGFVRVRLVHSRSP